MTRTRRILFATLVLVAIVTTMPLSNAETQGGWYYEAVTGSTNPKGKEEISQVHAWISGPYAKIQFVDAPKKGMFHEGAYLMTKDGSKTIYLVDPKEETYSIIDVEAMLNFATTMLANMDGMVNLTFENIQNAKLLEEDGGTMLGRGTVHHRWQSSYTLTSKVLGFKSRNDIEMLQDIWFAEALDDSPGFQLWLNPGRIRTGNNELDEILGNEFAKIEGRFPLKNMTVMTTTNKKGKQSTTRTWTEVTVLREEPFDLAYTEIPENYELAPMMLPTTGVPAGSQTTAQSDDSADGQGEEDEEEVSGIEKAKKKFTGLFKKKKKKQKD